MYNAYFGLREKPFALTPNTEFLVKLAPYQACLNLLHVTLAEGEGFIKITGEVGTGKTLICRTLLTQLDSERYQLAYLPNPGMGPSGLRQALARELHIDGLDELDTQGVLDVLHHRLIEIAESGKSTVLLIDEAQGLPAGTLEALRLLTNLETKQSKLLQVVLFGQPELDTTLARNDLRQLRQRITFSYRLGVLDKKDTERYVHERLAVAGYQGAPLFTPEAVQRLVRDSAGIPRLINILANKSLMAAYGEGRKQVTSRHVALALRDTEGAHPFTHRRRFWSQWQVVILTLMVLTIGVGLGVIEYHEVLK